MLHLQVTTVAADGPYTFMAYGQGAATNFANVRFEASGGADLLFTDLLRSQTGMTFTGVTDLVRFETGLLVGPVI